MHAEILYAPREAPEIVAVLYEFEGSQRACVELWEGASSVRINADPLLLSRALHRASETIIRRMIDRAAGEMTATIHGKSFATCRRCRKLLPVQQVASGICGSCGDDLRMEAQANP